MLANEDLLLESISIFYADTRVTIRSNCYLGWEWMLLVNDKLYPHVFV